MTIQELAHQDSTERATALHGFGAWLDAQQPTPEEQEEILNHMHEQENFKTMVDALRFIKDLKNSAEETSDRYLYKRGGRRNFDFINEY